MTDGPCAICDNTNRTTRLCDTCRRDPSNDGWSEGEDISFDRLASADSDVDVSSVPEENNIFALSGRRARRVTVARQMALVLIDQYKIRVPYRNRGPGRRRQPWVWRSRPLNLSEVAWLVGITPQAVVQAVRFELEIERNQRRVSTRE